MKKWLAVAALFLAGCSSAPETNTYLLPAAPQTTMSHVNVSKPMLVVRPVEMASHLNGSGLVYQVSDTKVVEAQNNLWAEAINKQLTRRITDDLRNKQNKFWPTQLTPTLDIAGATRLQVRIDQFNGTYNGIADVAGEWMVMNANGELESVHPFEFKVSLAEPGYNAQVLALSKGVDELTSQIAQQIK
ncbi:membrane integrity-associated transporter subunit PqiC [Photobacterium damselae]|uniref:PqiC family protein n=1 Tax=Photobacterium damselae TaxID=38293 RepID=UPI001EDF47F1|nr:ABC-type transport auxiliary lipoprotein family protein [Photobacterium damselae]MCG3817319.1 membrane integrity-associated transporter subunit PqiC [Photobacterium damselae]